ncbi:MAG: hypothetical protein DRG78_11565 [Epsilonproteobacteria bacterium]|nr:MAG: hypothetical protein DRG78_11565 [Campylobacterota bacterium]
MKKLILITLIVFSTTLILSGCGGKSDEKPKEEKEFLTDSQKESVRNLITMRGYGCPSITKASDGFNGIRVNCSNGTRYTVDIDNYTVKQR